MGGAAAPPGGFADLHPRDEDIATWAHRVKEMASLTAQRKMIRSASGYELIRARRLVLFVFGYLRRIARAAECLNEFEVFGRQLLIVLGRPAVLLSSLQSCARTPSGTRSSHRFWTLCRCCRARRSWLRGCALPGRT